MENLATLDYWIKAQGKLSITLNENNVIENWINENLHDTNIKTSIEIGCYPGKFLTILGKKGVEVNGIDYIPSVTNLGKVFETNGYNVGEFIKADFTQFKTEKKYDCVMSFGFIEHFIEWKKILELHLDLVSENGYVIIEAPNFRGVFQRIPRFFFDYKNYKRHNINSMNLKKWNNILKSNGFEIISSSYFGGYELWFESTLKNAYYHKARRNAIRILIRLKNKLYKNRMEDSSFSCVMGIIARKLPSK